jgi:hypothetical protein
MEKFLVRGLIAGLLVLVAIEGIGWNSHKTAVAALSKKIKAVEDDSKAPEVTEKDVQEVLGGKQPVKTEQYPASGGGLAPSKKLEVYSWFTFNPANKRELWIHYARKGVKDDGPATVVFVSTDDQEAKPIDAPEAAPSTAGGGAGASPMGGGMQPGMGSPGGGRRGGRGGRGRPGAAAADADKADGDKADADKTDADKTDADKTDADKTDADKPDDAKPDDAKPEGDKPEGATSDKPQTNAGEGDDKKPEPEADTSDAKPDSGQE